MSMLIMIALILATVACAEEPEPRDPTPVFNPTAASAGTVGEADETPSPAPGGAPAAPSKDADPAKGQQVFQAKGCVACHSTGENTIVGPGLAGLASRAGDRVSDLSADEYIRQSILEPGAHIVEGFNDLMPKNFVDQIPEEDLDDLVAYVKTLQ